MIYTSPVRLSEHTETWSRLLWIPWFKRGRGCVPGTGLLQGLIYVCEIIWSAIYLQTNSTDSFQTNPILGKTHLTNMCRKATRWLLPHCWHATYITPLGFTWAAYRVSQSITPEPTRSPLVNLLWAVTAPPWKSLWWKSLLTLSGEKLNMESFQVV